MTTEKLDPAHTLNAPFGFTDREKSAWSYGYREGHAAALASSPQPAEAVRQGFVQVPMHMTQAMRDVTDTADWTWEDLLAAAEVITEGEYAEIAASPSAPAQVPGWQSIAEAPEGELLVVFWLDDEDTETPERYDFDHLDDGVWKKHAESVEYFEMVAPPESRGPKRTAPYTHFLVPGVPVSAPTVGPLVTWTDSDGSQHSMPVHQAAKVLREFFEAWPAGLDEIEASIRSHKDILASASKWLHAAYDRPPQTPECKAVLDLVDCAAGLDAAAPTVGKEQS